MSSPFQASWATSLDSLDSLSNVKIRKRYGDRGASRNQRRALKCVRVAAAPLLLKMETLNLSAWLTWDEVLPFLPLG